MIDLSTPEMNFMQRIVNLLTQFHFCLSMVRAENNKLMLI